MNYVSLIDVLIYVCNFILWFDSWSV